MIVIEPAIEAKFGRAALKKSRLATFLSAAKKEIGLNGAVSVLLTGDADIRRLNRDFRHKDKATDVLSFLAPETVARAKLAGDLAISVETADREAETRGHALVLELQVLLLHGILHLAGYDHETDNGEMARKEESLRRKLGLNQGLIARSSNNQPPAKKAAKKTPAKSPKRSRKP